MSAAFVIDAVRTPFGRYGGGLSGARPDDLGAHVVRTLLERSPSLDPARIDDVLFGDANGAGRTTATSPAWRRCSPACRRACQVRRSIACAARASMRRCRQVG